MVRLSVNVNKVATLRNSRHDQGQGTTGRPSVCRATAHCIDAGARGITVHPRPDARHITFADARDVAALLEPMRGDVEFNIEGDPRPDLVDLVLELRPDQFTLVPVRDRELTSQAGWPAATPREPLVEIIDRMQSQGTRVSVFVDPEESAIRWAASLGARRVELFTEPYARAWDRGPSEARESFGVYVRAANLAHELGMGVNAGHDLDEQNLELFSVLPHLDEVSIGHAIMAEALFDGLTRVVRRYLALLSLPAPQ